MGDKPIALAPSQAGQINSFLHVINPVVPCGGSARARGLPGPGQRGAVGQPRRREPGELGLPRRISPSPITLN